MKDLILNHWTEIVSVVVMIISVLLWLFKKPVSSSLESDIISDLIVLLTGWINSVEVPGNGQTKKEEVMSKAINYVQKSYHRSLDSDEYGLWSKRISTLIELVLSTPQSKKGEKNG